MEIDKSLVELKDISEKENQDDFKKRLMRYMELLAGYRKYKEPDREQVAELVVQAKGDRSMRQFAADIGVNVSTLSRVINQKTSTANSDELMAKIAAGADSYADFSFERIMDANGKIEADARKTAEAEEYIQKCKQILLTGLIGRGYSVKEVTQEVPMCDWILQTDAVDRGEGHWGFEFKKLTSFGDYSGMPTGSGKTRRAIDQIFVGFYTGKLKVDKMSLIVDRAVIYEQTKNILEQYVIPDEVSLILLKGNGEFEEYVVPMKDNNEKTVF